MTSNRLARCLEIFKALSEMSLRFRPKNDVAVDSLGEVMRIVRDLGLDELKELRVHIDRRLAMKLMYLSVLAAERAMNRRDADWLTIALMVHVVEGFVLDYRENYLRLYAIEYAAWRASLDLQRALHEIEPLMDDQVRKRLGDIFEEPHGESSLNMASLGVEVMPDGEVRFIPRAAA